jgi:hypothetical protein
MAPELFKANSRLPTIMKMSSVLRKEEYGASKTVSMERGRFQCCKCALFTFDVLSIVSAPL